MILTADNLSLLSSLRRENMAAGSTFPTEAELKGTFKVVTDFMDVERNSQPLAQCLTYLDR